MFEHQLLTKDAVEALATEFVEHEHFQYVVLPRLVFWYQVKQLMVHAQQCEWTFRWSPANVNRNEIALSLLDNRGEFHFYYAIPLVQKMKIQLYLGDNTFNYFEAFPLLVKHGVLTENEFKTEATLNSLPSLILSKQGNSYGVIEKVQDTIIGYKFDAQLNNTAQLMDDYFKKFNQPLLDIINGSLLL